MHAQFGDRGGDASWPIRRHGVCWSASQDPEDASVDIFTQARLVAAAAGVFAGASEIALPQGLQSDFGPAALDPRHGLAAVGAVPWVVNYNVLLRTQNMAASRSIARAVSSRGGGLACVEAMALQHDKGGVLKSPTYCGSRQLCLKLCLHVP